MSVSDTNFKRNRYIEMELRCPLNAPQFLMDMSANSARSLKTKTGATVSVKLFQSNLSQRQPLYLPNFHFPPAYN